MIEVTKEMVQLVYERIDFHNHGIDGIAEGLAAVFALVERDYRLVSRRHGRGEALHRKATGDLLREVAEVYRATKGRPVDAVAAHLNCATRTAWLWIRRAREAGFLPGAAS